MAEEWQKSLSFTDRLTATSKMQVSVPKSAYRAAHDDCKSAEASKYARASEEKARKCALSLREYHDLCSTAASELLSLVTPTASTQITSEHDDFGLEDGGTQIGRYTNAQKFKDGLFSEVFKARNPDFVAGGGQSKTVALKVTTPSMMAAPHDTIREARLLERAKNEHVIILLKTFQQAGGKFVLAFPFMPYDLDNLLIGQQLTNASRLKILKDIFSGLAHLHDLGIIHRDVKPSNILLASPNGPACLADFGTAWSSSDAASEPADHKILDVGTTCYRPPELLFGYQSYGTSLDMWAAGCVAAQVVCLNRQTLFDAGDLGSELALIKSMFETLGTPTSESWPEAAVMPDWGKMNFRQYSGKSWENILPGAEHDATDLVSQMVVFESSMRLSAGEALEHPYMQ